LTVVLAGLAVSVADVLLRIKMAFIPTFLAPSMSMLGVSPTKTASDGATSRLFKAFWKISGLGFRLLTSAEITITSKNLFQVVFFEEFPHAFWDGKVGDYAKLVLAVKPP